MHFFIVLDFSLSTLNYIHPTWKQSRGLSHIGTWWSPTSGAGPAPLLAQAKSPAHPWCPCTSFLRSGRLPDSAPDSCSFFPEPEVPRLPLASRPPTWVREPILGHSSPSSWIIILSIKTLLVIWLLYIYLIFTSLHRFSTRTVFLVYLLKYT